MRCALILTVRNEADSLPRLLETLALQSKQPDEIIIADGGSTDGTLALLHAAAERMPLRLLECPGANISQGRNAAIAATRAEVIACTDAGVRLDPGWFQALTNPFLGEDAPDVVSGFFSPDPHGVFETALAATTLPTLDEIHPAAFLPSSRSVAFRRAAWERVGGYPEWLDYCEDLIYDFALRDAGYTFRFEPRAVVHFRPRPTLARFFRQYYLYARGDGKADLWLKRHLIRYATYLGAIPASFAILPFAPAVSILMWLVGAFGLFGTPYRRLFVSWKRLSLADKLRACLWIPVIRVTGDIAKMVGYPVGVQWRLAYQRTPARAPSARHRS